MMDSTLAFILAPCRMYLLVIAGIHPYDDLSTFTITSVADVFMILGVDPLALTMEDRG